VRTKSPRYLVYFKALYGIAFVGGPGLFATNRQQDDLPTVMINESYLDKVAPELQSQLVSAAVNGVHAMLMPQAAAPRTAAADSVTYKGYTIQTTSDEDGRRFVEFVKFAIDMTEQLPPDLLKLARAATDLRYEPHVAGDKRGGALYVGGWRHDPRTGKGYMSYSENYAGRGQSRIAITLVGAGIYVRRDQAGHKAGVPVDDRGDCEMRTPKSRPWRRSSSTRSRSTAPTGRAPPTAAAERPRWPGAGFRLRFLIPRSLASKGTELSGTRTARRLRVADPSIDLCISADR